MPIDDPVLVFAVVALLILLAPFVMGRLRLPGMVGLLLAGALLGPNALDVLARDESFVLFGTVGLLYIMFTAALEIDLAAFKRYRNHSIVYGMLTFALPQGLGTCAGHFLLGYGWPAAILLGSLFASHTLLAYPIVSRLGIHTSMAVTTTVGATMLTDTLALLVLAVIAGSTKGEADEAFWYRLVLSMTAYIAIVLIGVPRLGRWFYRRMRPDGVSEFAFVLAVVFAISSLSHAAGVEPIVGAFLAGFALNRLIPQGSALMSRIHFTGEAIFVPFFLLSVGMLLDVHIFTAGTRSWAVALTMLVAVVLTKWLAAHTLRLVFRFNRDEANVAFGLSVAQAAATLAATLVGFDLGIFDEAVVNGAILMILGTCILSPLVVDRAGRRMALATSGEHSASAEHTARTLVALSPKRTNGPLLELAALLRAEQDPTPMHPLAIIEEGKGGTDLARAEKILALAVHELAAADIPSAPIARIDMNLAGGILRARKEVRATQVVIGWSSQSSTENLLWGRFVDQLLKDPEHTLFVARLQRPLKLARRVLLLLPPNAVREAAFPDVARHATSLAKRLGATLRVYCERGDARRVEERLAKVRPAAEVALRPLESWSSLVQALALTLEREDLTLLYAGREGTLSFRHSLAGLPSRLAQRFPDANLLAIHPAAAAPRATADSPRAPVLRVDGAAVAVDGADVASVVVALLASAPPGRLRAPPAEIAAAVAETAHELTPGVVLVHAEHPAVDSAITLVGVSRDGFTGPLGTPDARVIFVLLDPPGRGALEHLETLSNIARVLQQPSIVASLRDAPSADEVARLLAEPAHAAQALETP